MPIVVGPTETSRTGRSRRCPRGPRSRGPIDPGDVLGGGHEVHREGVRRQTHRDAVERHLQLGPDDGDGDPGGNDRPDGVPQLTQGGHRQRRQPCRQPTGRVGGPRLQLGIVEGRRCTGAQRHGVADRPHHGACLALGVVAGLVGERVEHQRQRVGGRAGHRAETRRVRVEGDVGTRRRAHEHGQPGDRVEDDVHRPLARLVGSVEADAQLDPGLRCLSGHQGEVGPHDGVEALIGGGIGSSPAVTTSRPSRA